MGPFMVDREEEEALGPLGALRVRAARRRKNDGSDTHVEPTGTRVATWKQMEQEQMKRDAQNRK